MELPILIIVSLTLLAVVVFLFIYWKSLKQERQLSENRLNEMIAKLDAIRVSLDELILKEFGGLKTTNEAANKLLINELAELKKFIASNIKELSMNYETQNKQVIENFKNEFQGVKSENKQFKTTLTDSHNETLKNIKDELTKISKEIKAPLDLD